MGSVAPEFLFHPEERVAVFIDGANLYQAARGIGFDIDYKRLLRAFSYDCRLIRAYYYTALLDSQEYSPVRPLVDWLDYNGYTMVTKPLREFTEATGRRKYKGNMDVEIAVDVMELAPNLDHVVLLSGDGDFRRLVEAVQRRGVRVTVVSTIRTQPPMVADELRRQADRFVDLAELQPYIAREYAPRSDEPARVPAQAAAAARVRTPTRMTRTTTAARRTGTAPPAGAEPGGDAGGGPRRPEPAPDCPLCPRLAAFRDAQRRAEPGWFNAPVPPFGPCDAGLVVVGLAPGLRGANRTGRAFTGDFAGEILYPALARHGLALGRFAARTDDGFTLVDCRIVNAARCVPPQNRPTPAEVATCRRFLAPHLLGTADDADRPRVVLALGRIAHESVVRAYGLKPGRHPFAHGGEHPLPGERTLVSSYHTSRYNVNTGVLTPEMFDAVVARAAALLRGVTPSGLGSAAEPCAS